jgi:hypothetical protein
MPRTRLNALSAPKKTAVMPSLADAWRTEVVCPSCGGPVEERELQRPRRWCTNVFCDFRYGWVLRPTSEIERTMTLENGVRVDVKRVVAVPLSAAGDEVWALQAPWPRQASPSM